MSTPFHSRADWGARPARYVTRRTLTMDTAHYGGPSPWGSSVDRSSAARFYATADHNRCATIMRAYQAFHMDSRGWADFAYSSAVCPHGHRYEGRGLDVRTAAQGTNIGNNTSHATCYLAGDGDPLTPQAMAAYVDESRRLRGLKKGHRDWKPTACPGDPLYRWVHSSQSAPAPTPAPRPPTPTPKQKKGKMLYLVKPDDRQHWFVTDWLTKRHLHNETDANLVKWFSTLAGQPISTAAGGQPHVLKELEQKRRLDDIPLVGEYGAPYKPH